MYFRKGHASQVSPAVEEVTGIRPTSFNQFAEIMWNFLHNIGTQVRNNKILHFGIVYFKDFSLYSL